LIITYIHCISLSLFQKPKKAAAKEPAGSGVIDIKKIWGELFSKPQGTNCKEEKKSKSLNPSTTKSYYR